MVLCINKSNEKENFGEKGDGNRNDENGGFLTHIKCIVKMFTSSPYLFASLVYKSVRATDKCFQADEIVMKIHVYFMSPGIKTNNLKTSKPEITFRLPFLINRIYISII